MNDNRCVCCGAIIPEGLQVCLACAIKAEKKEKKEDKKEGGQN